MPDLNEARKRILDAEASQSETLDLSGLGLTASLMKDLGIEQLKSLKQLNLSNNRLRYLPDCLQELQLSQLDLKENKLESLLGIERNEHLLYLDVSNNKLVSLPGTMAALKNLSVLLLKGNDISAIEIPKELIGTMAKVDIYADGDNLKKAVEKLQYQIPPEFEEQQWRLFFGKTKTEILVELNWPVEDSLMLVDFMREVISQSKFGHLMRNDISNLQKNLRVLFDERIPDSSKQEFLKRLKEEGPLQISQDSSIHSRMLTDEKQAVQIWQNFFGDVRDRVFKRREIAALGVEEGTASEIIDAFMTEAIEKIRSGHISADGIAKLSEKMKVFSNPKFTTEEKQKFLREMKTDGPQDVSNYDSIEWKMSGAELLLANTDRLIAEIDSELGATAGDTAHSVRSGKDNQTLLDMPISSEEEKTLDELLKPSVARTASKEKHASEAKEEQARHRKSRGRNK